MTITLDKERPILINMNALEAFEDMVGKPFGEIDPARIKELKALIYCALKEADENFELSLSEVGKYATPKEVGKVSKQLVSYMTSEANEEIAEGE